MRFRRKIILCLEVATLDFITALDLFMRHSDTDEGLYSICTTAENFCLKLCVFHLVKTLNITDVSPHHAPIMTN